ncbi:glycoside hydrolase family 38 N-terminal domain-containing protein [Companilactobacillus sp. DQM5]|uniref:glycoside hydrolase family 38 N-terminal domain-containing protein n=1 Tax=Companilactobacillus sp. DQM5 TaxID=3463359 RepID=UPI00405990C1
MSEKIKVNVIPHTHWDFEWYFTRQDAMIQFIHNMDEVFLALENNKLEYYLIDGQMSIIDDYLQVCPEKKELFKKYIKSGKLFVGPWYTQTDELIISGESIIRNLQLGMSLAKKLGGYMSIGYLPDSFGQGQDMPKIYNGFNIRRAVFWRGLPVDLTKNRFFNWKSSDGSNVNVLNINGGYYAGVPLIEEQEKLPEILDTLKSENINDIVLPLGGDQRYIDFNLKEKISQANKEYSNYNFVESNYPKAFSDFENKISKLDVLSGEFIDPSVSKIHRSIYSSRYDLKYYNDKLERLVTETLEPLMVIADKNNIPYKKGLLDKIWKILVRNQAHDSAGGCNSDVTNEDINKRFKEAERLVTSEIDYLTRKMSISMKDNAENDFLIYNVQSKQIQKIIKVEVSTKFKNFKITNLQNSEIDYQILSQEKIYSGQIKRDNTSYEENKFYYLTKILIKTKIDAFGYEKYRIVKSNSRQKASNIRASKIENELIKLELSEQGLITITDKKNKRVINDAVQFEDSGDEGDTYDFSPAYKNEVYKLNFRDSKVEIIKGVLQDEMIVSGVWKLPKNLKSRANNKKDGQLVYEVRIGLKKDSKLIEFAVKINNKISDHRLRVLLNSNIKNDFSYADTPFGFINRKVIDNNLNKWRELDYKEEPSAIYPMIHFVNVHNSKRSYSVLSKGIKEYELVGDKFSNIALTMFRSVGFLGRPDLLRRPGVASGNQFRYIPTPESQLLKNMEFNFAINIIDDKFNANEIINDFHNYSVYLPHYQIQNLNKFVNTLEYFVMNKLPQNVEKFGYFNTDNINVNISAIYKGFKNNIIVRLINYDDNEIKGGEIRSNKKINTKFVDLEEKAQSVEITGEKIDLGIFKPGQIKTLSIEV